MLEQAAPHAPQFERLVLVFVSQLSVVAVQFFIGAAHATHTALVVSQTERKCGDGEVQAAAGETCDDGNTDTETCSYGDKECTACAADCKGVAARYCGDGKTTDNEQCDDGNTVTEHCAYGEQSCMVCNANSQTSSGVTSYSGDGTPDADNGEACDDGNTSDGDGCRATSQVESST